MLLIFTGGLKLFNEYQNVIGQQLSMDVSTQMDSRINIFGDGFKIEFYPEEGMLGIVIKDFDENQKIECSINVSFNKKELMELICLLGQIQSKLPFKRRNLILLNGTPNANIHQAMCVWYNILVTNMQKKLKLLQHQVDLLKYMGPGGKNIYHIFGNNFTIKIIPENNEGYFSLNFTDYKEGGITELNNISDISFNDIELSQLMSLLQSIYDTI